MVKLSSWGRLSHEEHQLASLADLADHQPLIAFGNGRSYGDACLNPGHSVWPARNHDRLISFDESTGRLVCESGVLLKEIQDLFVPRGWMLPVTPGTELITVGGAIANDVHGKNHHRMGCFGDQVERLELLRTNGERLDLSESQHPELFRATLGGLGLTGLILSAEIKLRRVEGPWLETETIPFQSLKPFFQLSDESEQDWEYTVAWIDCLSGSKTRGIFMRANHSTVTQDQKRKSPIKVPVAPPISLVNRLSLPLFNTAYYQMNARSAGHSTQHYQSFFYPLDRVSNWNLMYGPKGFYQYQSVVPHENREAVTQAMLNEISKSGQGSFLAVLKTLGDRQGKGLLSFARPGVSLALDFPNQGEKTLRLFEKLDTIVQDAGGRLYMAKDARMSRPFFESTYPNHELFQHFRDPGISSALSRRLMGK